MLPSESSDSLSGTVKFDFNSMLIIFTETKSLELTNKFRKDAVAYYVEAKWSTVASVAQIPHQIYGVLVVLGWNEAIAVLFNPLYFTILSIVLAASLVFYSRIFNHFSDEFLQLYHCTTWNGWTVVTGFVGLVGEVRRCRLSTFLTLTIRGCNIKRLLNYVNNSQSPCWWNPSLYRGVGRSKKWLTRYRVGRAEENQETANMNSEGG